MVRYNQDLHKGDVERAVFLVNEPEVELSEAELKLIDSPLLEDVVIIRRQITGRLAEDIRKRLRLTNNEGVFISELAGVAQTGDETWENFQELVVEAGPHRMDFETFSLGNNFSAMLDWLVQDVSALCGDES